MRKIMKEKRLLMEQETFLLHSQIIIQKVQQHSYYKKAKTIVCPHCGKEFEV